MYLRVTNNLKRSPIITHASDNLKEYFADLLNSEHRWGTEQVSETSFIGSSITWMIARQNLYAPQIFKSYKTSQAHGWFSRHIKFSPLFMTYNCIHSAAELSHAVAPRILNECSFTPRTQYCHRQGLRYTPPRRHVGLQHQFGHYGREETVLPLTAIEPWFLGCEKRLPVVLK